MSLCEELTAALNAVNGSFRMIDDIAAYGGSVLDSLRVLPKAPFDDAMHMSMEMINQYDIQDTHIASRIFVFSYITALLRNTIVTDIYTLKVYGKPFSVPTVTFTSEREMPVMEYIVEQLRDHIPVDLLDHLISLTRDIKWYTLTNDTTSPFAVFTDKVDSHEISYPLFITLVLVSGK